jgi:GT2 family glycosyltransferase
MSDDDPKISQVAVVVVTYNRADKLRRVLEHLAVQTMPPETIVVIDNASTDLTSQILAEAAAADPRVAVHRSVTNTGGAGGFAEGIKQAYATGADAVWLMDDDCYAAPDALERLVDGYHRAGRASPESISFAGSIVTWIDGSACVMNAPPASDDWADLIARGEAITLVDMCSFVSVLVPRWAIGRVGLPLRDYFIWLDDVEYTHRLRAVGRGVQVHDSVVVHDLAENQGVNVAHLDAASAWKFRYGLRNESSFLWHHADPYRWLGFVLLTAVRMRRGRVPWRLRLEMIGRILAGLRFNPRPEHLAGD